jgi:thiamine transport system substrate-binding protein
VNSKQPEADVFYGIDNTFLSRALDHQLFEPYRPDALDRVPDEFKLDPDFNVVPINYADVSINYDKAWFEEHDLPLPQTLFDLTNPIYKGLLVVENPATSSPGLCFLLATIAELGEDAARDFWIALKGNDVVIASDWETAYYTHFSGSSSKGACPMVVSYSTSPAAELIYAETQLAESPTASLNGKGMVWRQIECAGILKNTTNRALAEAFVDFLLSKAFQEDVPLHMFVYPVLPEAKMPPEFIPLALTSNSYSAMNPSEIAENRDRWVNDWAEWILN